ncbi:hypothetical protein [Nesterenkonia jeotgali]|uniref:DUF304 domain-containing protein n=1 Tax=Nesterenkonia jeotgali TaxID=317018 RepID=A0A0W8IKL7_9MICC|nr:hypothetical protein [Nesterenkonia jeotgali]KUG60500.1 hypothetical protein AVL63_09025 [Nesterenkonia jeotgali]
MKLKLVDGEQVIIRTRAHHRALLPALLNFLIVVMVMSFLLGYIARADQPAFIAHYHHIGVFLIWAGGLLALAFGTLKPLLAWANRMTYLTSHRVVQKNLIGAAQASVVPLGLLSEVQLKQSRLQAMSEAGDLFLLHGAYGQHQRTRLSNMPDAAHFQTVIAEELGQYRRHVAAQYASQAPAPGGYGEPRYA